MKKNIKDILMIAIATIAIAAIAAASSLLVSDIKMDKPPGVDDYTDLELLEALGQDVYYTATADYRVTSDRIITIDGLIDDSEPWVCVTPKAVDYTPIASMMNKTSNMGWNGKSELAIQTSFDARYVSDMRYYVAQDDNYIYIALREVSPFVDLNESGTFDDMTEGVARSNYIYRFGFNVKDYSQQIVMECARTYPFFTGLADSNKFYEADYSEILYNKACSSYKYDSANDCAGEFLQIGNENRNAKTLDGRWILFTEFQLDKAKIKEAYKSCFDVELTDFKTLFIGISLNTYKGGDFEGVIRPLYGTFTAEAVSLYGLPSRFIPDKIVFGSKK